MGIFRSQFKFPHHSSHLVTDNWNFDARFQPNRLWISLFTNNTFDMHRHACHKPKSAVTKSNWQFGCCNFFFTPFDTKPFACIWRKRNQSHTVTRNRRFITNLHTADKFPIVRIPFSFPQIAKTTRKMVCIRNRLPIYRETMVFNVDFRLGFNRCRCIHTSGER